ncbi:hypothetical protein PUN28_001429 [Cardiocondyla obscurior]|uniref:Uncharacterized protein n=1 Tax=Cardiocondyla obscurior TaxID=286306 RepID=A0AAW2H569_9HYME
MPQDLPKQPRNEQITAKFGSLAQEASLSDAIFPTVSRRWAPPPPPPTLPTPPAPPPPPPPPSPPLPPSLRPSSPPPSKQATRAIALGGRRESHFPRRSPVPKRQHQRAHTQLEGRHPVSR